VPAIYLRLPVQLFWPICLPAPAEILDLSVLKKVNNNLDIKFKLPGTVKLKSTVRAAQMSKERRKSFHKDESTGNHYEHDHTTGESRWMEKSEVNDLPPGTLRFFFG